MTTLKSVGVFWDIENCHVPKGKSALKIIERIRERFFHDCREAEFICVCDVSKESETTIKDLNDGQINVVHIDAIAKNAADDKIRQSLTRFSDSHPPGTKVILISSDVNFATALSDLRHRKKFDVILIHKAQVSEALLTCATEHYLYEDLIRDLPDRPGFREAKENVLVVYGYSKDGPQERVKHILKMLSNNCGGKVLSIGPLFAILRFDTPELLERAKKRMNGEDVYGRKITVGLPEETPYFNTFKKLAATHLSKRQESPSPQRRPGRERAGSRGFTPDPHDGRNSTDHEYSQFFGDNFGTWDQFQQAATLTDNFAFWTPGGPVYNKQGHMGSPSVDGQGNSPCHTLPNSNSEKYYSTKPSPSADNSGYVFGGRGRSTMGSGSPATICGGSKINPTTNGWIPGDPSHKPGSEEAPPYTPTDKQRLADIPIPSFGYREIPPPSMPPIISGSMNQNLNASAFDPIKLIETASQDSRAFMSSKSNPLGYDHPPARPESQPPYMSFTHPPPIGRFPYQNDSRSNNTNFTPSQTSAFTKHQPGIPASNHQNHLPQSRSNSVPLQQSNLCSEATPTFSDLHSAQIYCPQGNVRSFSQNSGTFKKPTPVHKAFKTSQNAEGFQRHQSPRGRSCNSRSSSREQRKSVSSDGEDRTFSPINTSSKQTFRQRLSSAPNPGITSASPTNKNIPPLLSGSPMPRPKQLGSNLYRVPTPDAIGDPSLDYHHPDFNSGSDPCVELIVSNLDYNIQPRDWRKIIYATFHPHVKILSIQVRLQTDHTSVATIRLPSESDARFAIAQFHRRKIGYKRINVQFKSDCSQSPADSLRADTIALLMEAKDNKLALSRLIDLFDKRFHKAVSVSDIFKMRDLIQIIEVGGGGRWVKLQPGVRRSPTPIHSLDEEIAEVLEQQVCSIHCPEGSEFYTDALNSCMLPNVMILRKHFSPQLHSLLLSHNGYIPIMSFPACYAAEFKPIEPVKEGGIPLEHVISCVPGVEITVLKSGIRVIQFQENREQFYDMMKGNSWQELGKISREVMELLRQQPTCTMPVSKFIPAYHHYFGRQCRVADYGYTKLQELFEAIPHAIQIIGTGDRKTITLSHRAQIKRFTTDIVKVVKTQPAKQIWLDSFSPAYEKVMCKPLFLPHYGVCYIEDALMDIPTTTLIVIEEGDRTLLALPQRNQTPEEVERMKQFALEVVDLLKHNPLCSMPFNKFIPAYHHHFGKQCRVSDYGFSKLTDLFEAVAHVIEIDDDGEERMIRLTAAELRKVLCEQLTNLIRPTGAVPINKILTEYAKHFGFGLKLEDFGVNSTKALLLKLKNHIRIEYRAGQEYAVLVKESNIPPLGLWVMQLLMDESGGSLPLMELCMRYESKFGHRCDVTQIREELSDFVQVDECEQDSGGIIRLTSQQMLGRNLRLLLLRNPYIAMGDLSNLYHQEYGVELIPALYGFPGLHQLLLSFPHILELKGKSPNKYILSSGVLAAPGTLPPSRVDVTSPSQFSMPASNLIQVIDLQKAESVHSAAPADTSSDPCCNAQLRSASDLLLHASQLWDPTMAKQELGGTCPGDLLANQLFPGDGPSTQSHKPRKKSPRTKKQDKKGQHINLKGGLLPSPREASSSPADGDQHSSRSDGAGSTTYRNAENDDHNTPTQSPARKTSLTHSQHSSSSQSSTSPVKRKTRIAASFKTSQEMNP